MLSVVDTECHKKALRAEYHYAECQYAECHYAEYHYAECHGAELDRQLIQLSVYDQRFYKLKF